MNSIFNTLLHHINDENSVFVFKYQMHASPSIIAVNTPKPNKIQAVFVVICSKNGILKVVCVDILIMILF